MKTPRFHHLAISFKPGDRPVRYRLIPTVTKRRMRALAGRRFWSVLTIPIFRKQLYMVGYTRLLSRECPALGAPLSGYVVASALTLREAMDLAGRQNEVASVIES